MPIRKKSNSSYKKYIIWAVIIALIALMLITFPASRHVTEVVLV